MQILDHSSSRLSRIPKKNIYIKLLKKSGEISRTRNTLIQSYSRCNSGRLFDFTSGEILTRNIRGISTQSSLEFRFGSEGIREVRIPGTLGRNFFFLFLFSFFFPSDWRVHLRFITARPIFRWWNPEVDVEGREKLKSHQRAIIVSSMSPTVPAKVKQFLLPYANDIALSLSLSLSLSPSPLFFVFVPVALCSLRRARYRRRTCVINPANFQQFVVIRNVYVEGKSKWNSTRII